MDGLVDVEKTDAGLHAVRILKENPSDTKFADNGVDVSARFESTDTEPRLEINRILREQGLNAALAWRERRIR